MTLNELYRTGKRLFAENGIEDGDFDALQLLSSLSGKSTTQLRLDGDAEASSGLSEEYLSAADRRIAGEPLQYITGNWDFLGNVFSVGEGVLIPRPETEELTELCISQIRTNGYKVVYDLCAGSGCIGLSVAKACPETKVFLFELYDGALYFTEKNRESLCCDNAVICRCDVLKGCPDGFPAPDVIISNPPYIESGDVPMLQKEVLREPVTALDGGKDGMIFYRALAEKWLGLIAKGGFAAVECGEGQAEAICGLFSRFAETKTIKDIYAADRFVVGRIR